MDYAQLGHYTLNRQPLYRSMNPNKPVYSPDTLAFIGAHKEVMKLISKENSKSKIRRVRTMHVRPKPRSNTQSTALPPPEPPKPPPRRFTQDNSSQSLSDYKLLGVLGRGAYSTVNEALHIPSNKRRSIKTYEKLRLLDLQKRRFVQSEISVLKKLSHPSCVQLYDVIETPKSIHLVMNYISGESLGTYLKRKVFLQEKDAKALFLSLASAVQYCHSLGITHRDIKLDNIIYDPHKKAVKLIDFGFSTCFAEEFPSRILCGTPKFMAPEIVLKKEFLGPPVDVWALGVVLFVMVTGAYPFNGSSEKELAASIVRGQFEAHSRLSEGCRRLLAGMLRVDPGQRAHLQEVLSDGWFKEPVVVWETVQTCLVQDQEDQTIDLDIVMEMVISKQKTMGFTEGEIFSELGNKKSKVSLIYKRIKQRKNRRFSVI